MGKRNRNGERLSEYARRNNRKIAGTILKGREERKWAWKSPNGTMKNEIDHTHVDL